ncbi:hypothetical protein I545_0513 [Mycobacterium kansasii 662]|uniref:Uncharacterized protein n=3 Tax=Mycobacterium kansasii TaxID=1768 RepID=A0A1V3XXK0_MYCKA|nr:hypothetical protein MKAN_21820 [Mycobacterium kansasii ATCC 12478]EUA03204.1 hypothetical protein I547_0861 [Mycobacterium kansasii 824]EUA21592.1 hypothetical protein I545_0513 [Mycobacterium kansasii 662]KEP43400.1 hypothetical protein MKSMC1_14410 [Mycobacterium kansasii]KZS80781.1 hypothetical protein A4G30_20400 [Mycobacterium kansasii]
MARTRFDFPQLLGPTSAFIPSVSRISDSPNDLKFFTSMRVSFMYLLSPQSAMSNVSMAGYIE